MQYNVQRQYVKRATIKKPGKIWQELDKKGLGTRLDMPNPKPKILFSILILVKNHYIKVLSDKNSYLQSF